MNIEKTKISFDPTQITSYEPSFFITQSSIFEKNQRHNQDFFAIKRMCRRVIILFQIFVSMLIIICRVEDKSIFRSELMASLSL